MSSDFFGHNLQFSDTPVEIDVNSIMGGASRKLPYRDLSSDGDYVTTEATATYAQAVEPTPEAFYQEPMESPRVDRFKGNAINALWGLGAFATVWLIGNLAIASRTGDLDDLRAYHLNSANRTLPVLSILGAGAVITIKTKLRN